MSDNEESPYSSDINDSDSDSDTENVTPVTKKSLNPIINKKIVKHPVINDYNGLEDEEDDVEDDEAEDDDVEDEDEDVDVDEDENEYDVQTKKNKKGGAKLDEVDDEGGDDEGDDDDDEEDKVFGEKLPITPMDKVQINNLQNYNSDDDDDDDDNYDENYLQKFDSETTKSYITNYHSECLQHNYAEIEVMTRIVRNSDNIIIDPLHRTCSYLTKYEKARVLGMRSKQIEDNHAPFIEVAKNIVDSYIIAQLELEEKKIPFIIKRPIPNGGFEYWKLEDLEIIAF